LTSDGCCDDAGLIADPCFARDPQVMPQYGVVPLADIGTASTVTAAPISAATPRTAVRLQCFISVTSVSLVLLRRRFSDRQVAWPTSRIALRFRERDLTGLVLSISW
jgi:hypothetical protein